VRKRYIFYLHTEKHKDIYEFLEGLNKPMRGDFIRTAIRFFIINTERHGQAHTGQDISASYSPKSTKDTFKGTIG